MNTRAILGALALVLVLGAPYAARGDVPDGLGTWEGTGTAHAVGGADLGGFSVSLVRKPAGDHKVRADGKVTLDDGRVIVFWQEIEDKAAQGFHIVSSNGTGGGRCFANGMCQSYEQRSDGHAFATTIVKDAPGKLRVLVTELEQGHAVRFMEQTLTKRP